MALARLLAPVLGVSVKEAHERVRSAAGAPVVLQLPSIAEAEDVAKTLGAIGALVRVWNVPRRG
jgi:ribosomal protein L7/L12